MTTPSTSAQGPDLRREEQLRIQAVGAAISRREWWEVEQAYNAIRDEFDRRPASPSPAGVLDIYREAVRIDVKMEGPQFMGCNTSALKRAWEADRASLASDATPAPTSGSEATCNASLQVAAIPRAENTGRYLAETNDGRLLYLNHAYQWQEMPNILAKPASSPAGGDVLAQALAMLDAESDDKLKTLWGVAAKSFASRIRALSSSAGPAEPVAYASAEQIAELVIDRPGDGGGAYIPLRKTPAGLFQMALYAHPAPATVESDEVSVAARFNRLAAICRRIKWRNVGEPAWNDKQTADALFDLAEWLFADGVDAALAPATEGRTS